MKKYIIFALTMLTSASLNIFAGKDKKGNQNKATQKEYVTANCPWCGKTVSVNKYPDTAYTKPCNSCQQEIIIKTNPYKDTCSVFKDKRRFQAPDYVEKNWNL